MSLKKNISRIYREASTRSCCFAVVCHCPATCYCLLGLSFSGLQIWTSSGTFSASSSKAGITTDVIRQVWVMSFPSATFLSRWVLEICLFWAELLNGDVTVNPKGSEEWRESLGCIHSAHLLPLLFTGGWRKLFLFNPRSAMKCWLLERGLLGMLKNEGKIKLSWFRMHENSMACFLWDVCLEACFLGRDLREGVHLWNVAECP